MIDTENLSKKIYLYILCCTESISYVEYTGLFGTTWYESNSQVILCIECFNILNWS